MMQLSETVQLEIGNLKVKSSRNMEVFYLETTKKIFVIKVTKGLFIAKFKLTMTKSIHPLQFQTTLNLIRKKMFSITNSWF